jgi:hypothetical protein
VSRAAAAAALLACALVPAGAHAHGGLPVSQHILRAAGSDQMYVPVDFWGLWVSQPDGRWKWICEEVINTNRSRKFVLSADGSFYVTDVKGLETSTDHGCTWSKVTGDLAGLHTTDADVDPVDGATAWVATGDGGTIDGDGTLIPASNAVYVTHDHGASWTPLAGLPTDRLFTSIRYAASDRLYVTSNAQSAPYAPTLHAGQSGAFTSTPLAYQLDGADPHALELIAVDPRDPSIVWARAIAVVPQGSSSTTRQALLRSSDAGMTWSELYKLDVATASSGESFGIDDVAFDVANKKVYVATRTGLLAGDDAGTTTVPTLAATGTLSQTQCVDVHNGAIYACSSQFQPDNAAVARSTDGAKTFSSVLNYVDTLGPVECPAGTPVGDLCPSYWYMYGAQLGISFDGGTGGGNDAGTMKPPGGCGCSIGGAASATGGVAAALLLLLAVGWRLSARTNAKSGGRARRRG